MALYASSFSISISGRKTRLLFTAMSFCAIASAAFSSVANAQGSKSKRSPSSNMVIAQKSPPAEAKPAAAGSAPEKVDIQDLEQKYWAPKDTEFNVVQNRLYTKAGRFGVSLQGGTLINDPYSDGTQFGGAVNYYFSETMGAELQYHRTSAKNNQSTQDYFNQGNLASTFPNHGKLQGYMGVNFNWIPIYAKMSLLEKKILYFDLAISPGVGMTEYKQQRANGNGDVLQSFTYSLDVSQHVYISRNFAFRLDMKNRFWTEKVVDYNSGVSRSETGRHAISVLLGITYLP